jgi:four helix bundle protein
MRDPGRLRVVEVALRVATLTYAATKQFPVAEWQGLVPQMRRAAASIGSNITEGCGRSSEKQFLSFLQIAMGSACELEFQCRLAHSLNYASAEQLIELLAAVQHAKRMLAKLSVNIRARAEAQGT